MIKKIHPNVSKTNAPATNESNDISRDLVDTVDSVKEAIKTHKSIQTVGNLINQDWKDMEHSVSRHKPVGQTTRNTQKTSQKILHPVPKPNSH